MKRLSQRDGVGWLFTKVMLVSIIAIGVVVPVYLELLSSVNVTGTTSIVLGLIPLFVALLLITALSTEMLARMN